MTDKVQKIREEVARIQLFAQSGVLKQILDYIDKVQKEPVSEDLEKELTKWIKEHFDKDMSRYSGCYLTNDSLLEIARHFANWQKEQDQSTIELAEDHAMLAGMEKMKEQMMKNAIEVTVHIEGGNYPYIPQMELYDYDKDEPLAKEGDKYKVILIKEDRYGDSRKETL